MSGRTASGAAIVLLAAMMAVAPAAQAGRDCEPAPLSAADWRNNIELATRTAQALDASGASAAVIGRVGQDLSAHRQVYSHLALVYRDDGALAGKGAWRVAHKLNACGRSESTLYRHGLLEFFSDGLHRWQAGIVILSPPLQHRAAQALRDNAALTALHEPRYSMLAYPWATRYQQSNQWLIETLAVMAEPGITSRPRAQAWLRFHDYQPDTVHVSALKRLGANATTAHIAFDDHPFGERMAGRIDTVTADSVLRWLSRSGLGSPLHVVTLPDGG